MKVLVANRGEIACRIFQACRELGLTTVGITVEGDEDARHVTYADEVYTVSSYLAIDSILSVAQSAQVTHIHPGYGFLSERSAFAESVERAGICFLGPSPETIELLGSKTKAKEIAKKAGVSTLPWKKVEPGTDLKTAAKDIGLPLLLKASAGGGGKGMRRVDHLEELSRCAEGASAEALASFGDGSLILERLIPSPRHIEVQIFGDGRGSVVSLFERECSLQRRYQKVWEEAPAPHLSESLRQNLHQAAVRLAASVNYRSAGTVEFLVDGDDYYFLEMNTRLQVEHPVTEMVTGVDLVRLQLAAAMNAVSSLPRITQIQGHAIEVRVYAEDPYRGFIPCPGKVEKLRWPTGAGIRIESGIEEGQNIGTQFDPMLAKLVVHGQDREHALARLRFALEETVVLGLGTNLEFLRALCDQPAVRSGRVTTRSLSEMREHCREPSFDELSMVAAFAEANPSKASQATSTLPSPWTRIPGGAI